MNKLPLRPNVCILVTGGPKSSGSGKLILGERHNEKGVWQFPQGGAEPDCSLEENVLREIEEELGISRKHLRIIKKLEATHEYDFENPPDYAVGVWRGQSQTFWLVEFNAPDSEVDLFKHKPEFMNWRWSTAAEVRAQAQPRRVPGYQKPLEEFERYLAENLANKAKK